MLIRPHYSVVNDDKLCLVHPSRGSHDAITLLDAALRLPNKFTRVPMVVNTRICRGFVLRAILEGHSFERVSGNTSADIQEGRRGGIIS